MKAFLGGIVLGAGAVALGFAFFGANEQSDNAAAGKQLPDPRGVMAPLEGEEKRNFLRTLVSYQHAGITLEPLWAPLPDELPTSSTSQGPLWVTEVKPTMPIRPEDIESVRFCTAGPVQTPPSYAADYENIDLEIALKPTAAFTEKLAKLAKDSLGENVLSPEFHLMAENNTLSLNEWQSSRQSVDNYAQRPHDVMITLHYTMQHAEYAMDMLSLFSHDGFELCDRPGPARDVLIDLMDAKWGENSAAIYLKNNK